MLHQHDFNHVQVDGLIGFCNGHHSIHYSLQTNESNQQELQLLQNELSIKAEVNKVQLVIQIY